jgi:hypothetical protein
MSILDPAAIGYKTHILMGVRGSGVVSAICTWPYVPRQAEVQEQIDATREPCDAFVLCTPTAILPGNGAAPASAGRESRRGSKTHA